MILWSIDTLDWENQNPQQIVDTTLSQVEDGSIVLMHDIFSTTVDAAEILIPELKKQGYEMVTVHELAKRNRIQLNAGTTYSDLKRNLEARKKNLFFRVSYFFRTMPGNLPNCVWKRKIFTFMN